MEKLENNDFLEIEYLREKSYKENGSYFRVKVDGYEFEYEKDCNSITVISGDMTSIDTNKYKKILNIASLIYIEEQRIGKILLSKNDSRLLAFSHISVQYLSDYSYYTIVIDGYTFNYYLNNESITYNKNEIKNIEKYREIIKKAIEKYNCELKMGMVQFTKEEVQSFKMPEAFKSKEKVLKP